MNASRDRAVAALEVAGLTHEVKTFDGVDHAFFNDTGPRYDEAAATEAYALVLDWFAAISRLTGCRVCRGYRRADGAGAHSGRQEGGTVATSVLIEPATVTATEPYVGPTARIEEFLRAAGRETPFLVVDLDVVASRYVQLVDSLPGVDVFFAVKANPAPEILELLVGLGANFDVASIGEIDACLAAGADPTRLSFGNTVKKRTAIRDAYRARRAHLRVRQRGGARQAHRPRAGCDRVLPHLV